MPGDLYWQAKNIRRHCTVKPCWMANNKVCEPRPILHNLQPPSIFTDGESVCACVWVRENESQTTEPAEVTTVSMCFATVLTSGGGGGGRVWLWTQTQPLRESDQWVIPAECSTGGYDSGHVTSLHDAGRGLDHLMAAHVEAIIADSAGWVHDSLARVSQSLATRG